VVLLRSNISIDLLFQAPDKSKGNIIRIFQKQLFGLTKERHFPDLYSQLSSPESRSITTGVTDKNVLASVGGTLTERAATIRTQYHCSGHVYATMEHKWVHC